MAGGMIGDGGSFEGHTEGPRDKSLTQVSLDQLSTELNGLESLIEEMHKRLEPVSIPKIQIGQAVTADRIVANGVEVSPIPQKPACDIRSQVNVSIDGVKSAATRLRYLIDMLDI